MGIEQRLVNDGTKGSKTQASIHRPSMNALMSPGISDKEGITLPKPGKHSRFGRSMDIQGAQNMLADS